MNRDVDEELRTLFAEIEAPPGLDRWRERIADVHAETCIPEQHEPDHDDDADDQESPAAETNSTVVALPTGRELRPRRRRPRSVAVAAAAAVIVGLGGAVLTTQLFSAAPPADPTMIIDGPDKSISSAPPTVSTDTSVPGSPNASTPDSGGENPPDAQRSDPGGQTGPGGPGSVAIPGGNEPVWGPLVGDPSADNTGVPPGSTLTEHRGDLRISTAGQVVSDLRVTGTVIVDAPYVTLTRVHVVAPNGAPAVRQSAASLTIENSELSGGSSLIQSTSGLTVRRSRLESGVTLVGGAELFDNYLNTADVLIPSGSRSIQLRFNVMGRVTMNDLDAPIRDVFISNNLLTQVDAPTDASSESIHVSDNRFRGSEPSTGWNSAGTDYVWSGNTFAETGATANP